MTSEPSLKAETDEANGGLADEALEHRFGAFIASVEIDAGAYCRSRCRNADDAKDVFQDACIALWRNNQLLKSEAADVWAWFFRVLYNQAVDISRKRRPETNLAVNQSDAEIYVDSIVPPPKIVEGQETTRRLRACLDRLTVEERENVILFHYDDKSDEEIATFLEIKRGLVRQRRFRACEKLRACLEEKERQRE